MQNETRIIGHNLREIRRNASLTQEKIAEVLGVSAQQVQKYEAGVNRLSAEKLYILKNFYDIPYDWFFNNLSGPGSRDEQSYYSIFLRLQHLQDTDLKNKITKILQILLN